MSNLKISRKSVTLISGFTLLVLLTPLLSMQFTKEVNWNVDDFALASVLAILAGYSVALSLEKVEKKALAIILAAIFILCISAIWIALAVEKPLF